MSNVIELSPTQAAASELVRAWLSRGYNPEQPVFRLFGYAGSGKTSAAMSLAEHAEGRVCFATFTGKASSVLRDKGCYSAQTIHSLIYVPKIKGAQHLAKLQEEMRATADEDRQRELRLQIEAERANLKRPSFTLNLESQLKGASLLVLDEVSMVGTAIAQDLLSFQVPILALGDPAQLPPVRDGGYFTEATPDVMLTEVHRQALDSPVLALATKVRQGEPIEYGDYGSSRVVRKGVLSIQELAAHDQVICGRNATRHAVNARIRKEVMGFENHLPVAGDKLVCRRNDRDTGLLNGTQWTVMAAEVLDADRVQLDILDPTASEPYAFPVVAHRHHFEGRAHEIAPWDAREAQHFEYGYVVTAHTAQGSGWPSVAVIDESACFKQDARRHLYTSITRASERVTVIR